MFVRIRHGANEELIVNPNCFVVNFVNYVRRNVNPKRADLDDVVLASCSEDAAPSSSSAVLVVNTRFELTAENGLVQGLDDLRPK